MSKPEVLYFDGYRLTPPAARTSATRMRSCSPTALRAISAWRATMLYFQTGTDEHGQKIEEKANAAGITRRNMSTTLRRLSRRTGT